MLVGRIRRLEMGAILLSLWPLLCASVRAEVPPAIFPSESRPTAARLSEARKRIDEKKWTEALDEVQAILDTAGNDLVALSPRYCVPARRQCHLLIAGLPPDALKTYRGRMEPQARKWLEQGQANRDVRLLVKVVDESFCTRSGETALETLGDLAFEQGRFEEAEYWWRYLYPPLDAWSEALDAKNDLFYPDPQTSSARIQARQVLARIFRNPAADRTPLLEAYRKRHPDAAGTLAGRKGRYADLLSEIARQAQTGNSTQEASWSTFGGDATRGLVTPVQPRFLDHLERQCRRGPMWSFDLETKQRQEASSTVLPHATPSVLARSLAFEPLIVGDHAVVADARYVTAYNLRTGKSQVWFDAADFTALAPPDLKLPLPLDLLDLRYTMTLADDCLYVRLGAQKIFRADDVAPTDPERVKKEMEKDKKVASVLACLSVKPDAKGNHLRWATLPVVQPGKSPNNAIFEGAPVVHHGQLYVAATYFENDRTVTSVVCYSTTTAEQPTPRWTQVVCETHELGGRDKRTRHHLLTVAGPHVVYCSHSGAIVALDTLTGKPAWALRYPSRDARANPPQPVLRDLSPPVFAEGRLYVAPTDYDHLLCLDPLTGQTIWEREHLEPTHLVGVGHERLIFTTLQGLRAVGAADGSDTAGWLLPDGGGERAPAGRGLLIGDAVLWPTANGVVVCNQHDGVVSYRPTLGVQVPSGNLVYAQGCLAVADRTTLSVFVPDALTLDERLRQARNNPDAVGVWLDLARSQADAGQNEDALASLQKAQALLRPQRDRVLQSNLRRDTRDVMLTQARRAAAKGEWAAADNAVKLATTADPALPARLETLVQAAQMWENSGQPTRAVGVWQSILATDELRRLSAFQFARTQLTAAAYATARIDHLQKQHGIVNQPRTLPKEAMPDEHPKLSLPLERQWQIKLAADEHFLPIGGAEELLLTGRSGQLTARAAETGKPRWNCRLSFTPRWAAKLNDTLVTSGTQGAACIRQDDGGVIWEVPAPSLFASKPAATMGSFKIANGRFFFLAGGQWLFALDAATGDVLWCRSAPGAGLGLPAPFGCFNPSFLANGAVVLVQPTPNTTLLLNAATGQPVRSLTFAAGVWWRSPLVRADGVLCFAPNARTIIQINGTTGETLWEHSLTASTTLTGEPPRLVGEKNALLALIATNLGDQLQHLDSSTGKPDWTQPILLSGKDRPDEPTGWALDNNAVYFTQGNHLYARSLVDGQVLWDKPLNGRTGPYTTRRLRDFLLTYPAQSGAARMQCRFLNGSLQWERGVSREDGPGFGFPILCSDPATGQVIERLNLSPGLPCVTASLMMSPRFTFLPVIELGPVESGTDKPVVQVSARGVVAAVGQQLFGFKPTEK